MDPLDPPAEVGKLSQVCPPLRSPSAARAAKGLQKEHGLHGKPPPRRLPIIFLRRPI